MMSPTLTPASMLGLVPSARSRKPFTASRPPLVRGQKRGVEMTLKRARMIYKWLFKRAPKGALRGGLLMGLEGAEKGL